MAIKVLIINDDPYDREWIENECRRLSGVEPIAPAGHSEWEQELLPESLKKIHFFLVDYDLSLSYGHDKRNGLKIAEELLKNRVSCSQIVIATRFDLAPIEAGITELGVRYLAVLSRNFHESLVDIITAFKNTSE